MWLRFHHPEILPHSLAQSFDQDVDLSLALPPSTDPDTDSSALSPIHPDTDPSLTSDVSMDTLTSDHSAQDENKENIPGAANSECASPQSESIPSTSNSLSETRRVFLYVTEFLTFPRAAPKPSKSSKKTPGGARVVTREESLALMKEKERKKRPKR